MKEDNKLLDAIIDLGVGMKELREEMKGMRTDINTQLGELNHRVDKLEKQQARTNMELGEIRLTFIQYADAIEKVIDHETRIVRLEEATFDNDNKKSAMAKEPEAEYLPAGRQGKKKKPRQKSKKKSYKGI
ncbi:MAG: hypothetical protein HY840_11830 [Bacteroidetes bacterium]|nr:hypothetical protein [Bacteroidota bacterium]